jgi:hypothetical protein
MAQPFFSAAEVAALEQVALTGMQTDISISASTPTDSGGISASNDYGDDVVTYPVVTDPANPSNPLIVKAWLWQQPTPVAVADTDQIVTVNTVRMYVPLGTPVKVGDTVHVVNDPNAIDYVVADTNAEITWKAWLTCSLRELE